MVSLYYCQHKPMTTVALIPFSFSSRTNADNVTIPIILTLLSEDGGNDEILMDVVETLETVGGETYSLTLSDIQVDRFGE